MRINPNKTLVDKLTNCAAATSILEVEKIQVLKVEIGDGTPVLVVTPPRRKSRITGTQIRITGTTSGPREIMQATVKNCYIQWQTQQ